MRTRSVARTAALPLALARRALLASACSLRPPRPATGRRSSATITAIGAENEYANVIAAGRRQVRAGHGHHEQPEHRPAHLRGQPGRRPGDQQRQPHRAERRRLRHLGEPPSRTPPPARGRKVIDVQQLLGLPDSTPNPHLWYNPATMPKVATAIAADLAAIEPAHAAYFKANAATFTASLAPGPRPSPRSRPRTRAPRSRRPSRSPTTCCRPPAPTT